MQSLLTPAESNAFQSFLSSVDYPEEGVSLSAAEWALYESSTPSFYATQDGEGDYSNEHRQALSKATKDLMSLDPDGWNSGSTTMGNLPVRQFNATGHTMSQNDRAEHERMLVHQQQVLQHQQQHRQQQQQQRHHSFPTTHEVFPFLNNKGHQQQQQQQTQYSTHVMQLQTQQQQHHSVPPLNTISSGPPSPTSPRSPYNFQSMHHSVPVAPGHHQQQIHIPNQQQHRQDGISSTPRMLQSQSTPSMRSASRPSITPSNSSPLAASSSSNGYANSSRTSVVNSTNGNTATVVKRQKASTSPPMSGEGSRQQGSVSQKQTLLSPSQKKANHIQSEQKRRANIRRGYEALCETVPALREAIRFEEEAERNMMNGRDGANGGTRKKSRVKKKDINDENSKDRLDGRAGPRSENVVLSKTIDHIQNLLAERSALLARLHHARSSLPPGHPALAPLIPDPPWEREWKGGEGRLGDEDLEGEGEEEDDDD